MCNEHEKNPFADIASLEEDIWDDNAPVSTAPGTYTESIGNVEIPGFVEKCPKCRGVGYVNIYVKGGGYGQIPERRECFKCKGAGKLQFKTATEARQRARVSARKRTERSKSENIQAFKAQFPVEAAWLIGNSHGNTFADSLRQAVEKYGHLTEKQMAAVRNGIARDDDRSAGFDEWCKAYPGVKDWLVSEAAKGNDFAASVLEKGRRWGNLTDGQLNAVQRNLDEGRATDAAESDLDLSDLPAGRYAVPDGDSRLKLLVRRPNKASRYHGWTFVSDDAAYGNRQTYGRQAPDGKYSGKCVEQLKIIMQDPMAASVAYGKLVGACGVCGRRLEDPESIAAGIGPVCAEKF